ncbi:hypothetical protein Pmar_PMAR002325, partial [Perkinsus marinus ATCC 50983]
PCCISPVQSFDTSAKSITIVPPWNFHEDAPMSATAHEQILLVQNVKVARNAY